MNTIPEILNYPNGTPVEAVQAKIGKVYEYRSVTTKYGVKSAQSFTLEDGSGNTLRCSIWEHPDLSEHEGKEYVFSGGKGGKGIVVKHDEYKGKKTVELSISKAGQLQYVEVFHRDNPGKAVSKPVEAPKSAGTAPDTHRGASGGPSPINGAKVGMALNNATLVAAHSGLLDGQPMDKVMGIIKPLTLAYIQFSSDLESGRIAIEAPETAKAAPAATTPENDEEVPY